MKVDFSVLDLCPILSGSDASQSFKCAVELAQFTEKMGYKRFWLAEHHSMQGIGSSSPEVLIAHIAAATKKIRVGSGGIVYQIIPHFILPIFRTLEALHPGRIDLGVGRAPGSGSKAAHALRRAKGLSADDFPLEFDDLIKWLNDDIHDGHQHAGVLAVPTNIQMPDIWILGSSDFGAQFAAFHGMPYAFAQHFSHAPALEIIRLYRENYRPSKWYPRPKVILGTHMICAETDDEARELAMSSDLSFSIFVNSGKSIPLPTVKEAKEWPYTESDWDQVRRGSMPKFVGSPEKIKNQLQFYIDSKLIDEVMVLSMIHDQTARKKSYELIWKSFH